MEVLEEKVNLYESNGFSLEKLLENEKEKCQKLTEAKDKEIEQLWLEIDSKQAIIGALEELQANSKSQFEKRNKTTSDKPKEKTHPAISKIESYVDDHNNLIVECPDIWVFRNSFFFAGVVGTTIGYGDVYPTTRGGKIFSMFYALTSVPFFNFLLGKICESVRVFLFSKENGALTDKKKSELILLYTLVGMLITMFIPAVLFKFIENRTFLDAFYFVVISLTTVGFGDITPSFKDSLIFVIYRFMVLMWIFFGLAYIGGLAPLINEIFNNYIYAELYMKVKRQFSERWLRQNEEAAKISELVQKVHVQEILTEFEDELNAYSVNRQKEESEKHLCVHLVALRISSTRSKV